MQSGKWHSALCPVADCGFCWTACICPAVAYAQIYEKIDPESNCIWPCVFYYLTPGYNTYLNMLHRYHIGKHLKIYYQFDCCTFCELFCTVLCCQSCSSAQIMYELNNTQIDFSKWKTTSGPITGFITAPVAYNSMHSFKL